ncbi:MAG: FAD-dependent oxidoreductase [Candidatus Yanofskybacteria bacterium]|nr:FAD-dependent oxidoreductase [Candidatus Yanofskybacteria bacterium]
MVKILILGGGFGGIRCALDLEKKLLNSRIDFEITLVDRNGYHLFAPSIYEVASAFGIKRDPFAIQLKKTVCIPYADIFSAKGGGGVNFIEAEISSIDLVNREVTTQGGHNLAYDYLVFGIGGETTDFNIPGVRDYAQQFKNLEDALFINQKLDKLTEGLIEGSRTDPFSFLICGGGFTGVELAAELGCCTQVIKERCHLLRGRCSNITLFEAGPKILPMITDRERVIIKKRLTKLGIVIMENSPIEEVGFNSIKLKNGRKLEGDLIIWTAGIKPNRFLSQVTGLTLAPSGRVAVDEELRIKGLENVFAIGDNIEFIDPKIQKPVPAMAYVAVDQGKIAAKNISELIKTKQSQPKLKKYNPFYGVWVVPVGGKYAVAHLTNSIVIKGFMGWLVRAAVDIRYFMSILPIRKALKLYWEEITVFIKND